MKTFLKYISFLLVFNFFFISFINAKTNNECKKEHLKRISDAREKRDRKEISNDVYIEIRDDSSKKLIACTKTSDESRELCKKNSGIWDYSKGCVYEKDKDGNNVNILELRKGACETVGGKWFNGSCSVGLEKGTLSLATNPNTGKKYTEEEIEKILGSNSGDSGNTPGGTNNGDTDSFVIKSVPSLEKYCSGKKFDKNGLLQYDGACDGNGGVLKPNSEGEGQGYSELIGTFNRVIKWIVNIALLIAAAMAFYGGWIYISGATNPAARSKANTLFKNVAIGLFLIFAAWFIVKFILFVFAKGEAVTEDVDKAGNFSGLSK